MRLIVEIPDEMHRDLKARAAADGRTQSSVVRELIGGYVSPGKGPVAPAKTGALSKKDQAAGRTRK